MGHLGVAWSHGAPVPSHRTWPQSHLTQSIRRSPRIGSQDTQCAPSKVTTPAPHGMPLRLLEPSYSAINDVVPVGVLSVGGGGGGCTVKCPYNGGLPLLWVTHACARAVPSGTKQKCKAKVNEKSSSVTCHRCLSLQQTRQRIHRCSLHLKPYDLAVWSMESSRICCRTSLQSFKCQTAEVPLPFMICGCSGTPAPGMHTLKWADYSTDTMRYEGWWDAGGRPRWGRRHTNAAPPRRNSPQQCHCLRLRLLIPGGEPGSPGSIRHWCASDRLGSR